MHEPKGMCSASSFSPSSSLTTPSTMAPKNKKSGPSDHPSTSKAPPLAASFASEDAGASEDVNPAGGMVGAGGTITTPPVADKGAGDVVGEQHQQHLGGHAPQGADEGVTPFAPPPPTDRRSRSNNACSGVSHRPPAAPPRERPQPMRLLPDEPTRPLRSIESLMFEHHRCTTPLPRWSSHSSVGAPPPLAPSGPRQRCGRRHRHPRQAQP